MTAVTAMRLTTMADLVVILVRAMLTVDMHKKFDVEGSDDDSSDSVRSLVDAKIAERNAKIHKRREEAWT
jgi:non-homologous end joining protein Ku